MGQKSCRHAVEMPGRHPLSPAAQEEARLISWEVHIARGCLHSFNRMLSAHAIVLSLLVTVNLIGFLQPPRGWDSTGHIFHSSKSLTVFSIANSFSLFTATSGLLFYIYCSHAAIVSLQSIPLPDKFDDPSTLDLLHKLRAALRRVDLPSVKRRCAFLFSFLACSLVFCMIAYISAGIASVYPHDRAVSVILPAIPGCLGLLFLLHIGASKLRLELDFNTRFAMMWSTMAPHIQPQPPILRIDHEDMQALDPLPYVLSWFHRAQSGDRKSGLLNGR